MICLVKRRLRIKSKSVVQRARQEWKEIAGRKIFFRSNWEYRYAVYLQELKEIKAIKDWAHEPKTFWFEKIRRGTRSYLPDFRVDLFDGTHYWVEVKGYFDRKSLTKLKRFGLYYPEEKLIVVDKTWFEKNR